MKSEVIFWEYVVTVLWFLKCTAFVLILMVLFVFHRGHAMLNATLVMCLTVYVGRAEMNRKRL
jgi:hypothetical protein